MKFERDALDIDILRKYAINIDEKHDNIPIIQHKRMFVYLRLTTADSKRHEKVCSSLNYIAC